MRHQLALSPILKSHDTAQQLDVPLISRYDIYPKQIPISLGSLGVLYPLSTLRRIPSADSEQRLALPIRNTDQKVGLQRFPIFKLRQCSTSNKKSSSLCYENLYDYTFSSHRSFTCNGFMVFTLGFDTPSILGFRCHRNCTLSLYSLTLVYLNVSSTAAVCYMYLKVIDRICRVR